MGDTRRLDPDGVQVRELLRLISTEGLSLYAGCQCVGISPALAYTWLSVGRGHQAAMLTRRPSLAMLDACRRFVERLREAELDRERLRLAAAKETLYKAAEEGHRRTKIRRKTIKGEVVEEVTEVEQGSPDWRAAVAVMEKLAPEQYGPRSNVHIRQDITLQPGEADAIAQDCSDVERKAIEKGDTSVLAAVVARVRAARALTTETQERT